MAMVINESGSVSPKSPMSNAVANIADEISALLKLIPRGSFDPDLLREMLMVNETMRSANVTNIGKVRISSNDGGKLYIELSDSLSKHEVEMTETYKALVEFIKHIDEFILCRQYLRELMAALDPCVEKLAESQGKRVGDKVDWAVLGNYFRKLVEKDTK